MAKVSDGIETLPKISIAWVGCTNITDDRQTDGRTTTYSELEREFTFAKKHFLSYGLCSHFAAGLSFIEIIDS